MKIEDIDDHFCRDDNWWGSFHCPNCNQQWGPPDHGDHPVDEEIDVKCDCGAIIRVNGEWVSEYAMDVEYLR